MEGKFISKETPGRACTDLHGFSHSSSPQDSESAPGFSRWNCACWNHLGSFYNLLMPGHPKIYSEAIKLTLRVTHLHKTPPRTWDGKDPAMCSQGHSFAKFIKVRYCFVLLLNKGSQTVCSSGPTTWIHPCTQTPPNPIQSDSGM